MYWIKFHSKFVYMTAKATGQEHSPSKMQPSQCHLKHQQSSFCRQVQVPRDSSETVLSSGNGLSKISAAFWNSSRLLSSTQPDLQCCYTCLAQEGIGPEELNTLSQPKSRVLVQSPAQCSLLSVLRKLREASEAAGVARPSAAMALCRPRPLSGAGLTAPHRHCCCGTARPQIPPPQGWPVSPAKQGEYLCEPKAHLRASVQEEPSVPCQTHLAPLRASARHSASQGNGGLWIT